MDELELELELDESEEDELEELDFEELDFLEELELEELELDFDELDELDLDRQCHSLDTHGHGRVVGQGEMGEGVGEEKGNCGVLLVGEGVVGCGVVGNGVGSAVWSI